MNLVIKAFVVMLATAGVPALAQNYPTKPVRMILAFPPGSSTDIVGRLYTQKLSEYWGQTVLADNRGGAGGSIAGAIAAKAAADGYTFLIHSSGHAVNPSLYSQLPYDTLKDFVDVAPLVEQPLVLVTNPSSAFKSTADLIARAKAKPGSINFASAGVGSGTHFGLEKLKLAAAIDMTHVTYKGSGEVLIDVIAGRVDFYLSPISAGLSHIQSGKLRALAVSTAKRNPSLPNVPTIAESGVPGFEFSLWFGVWAPTGVPAAIINKVAADIVRAGENPEMRAKLVGLGNDTMKMTPAQFAKFVREEMKDYARIVKAAGIKPL
ncbi:MAG: tripartite tricarboxylate transporter substrate binding protein [Pseudomonadota bacterium]